MIFISSIICTPAYSPEPVRARPLLAWLVSGLVLLATTSAFAVVDEEVGAEERGGPELLDHIIAVINDDVITQFQFEREIAQLRRQNIPGISGADFESEKIRNQVLQKMIDDNLVLQMANRAGIVIDELTMDSYMRQLANQNDKTLTEFRTEVLAIGMSFDEFRERTRSDLIRQRMIYGYVGGRIVVLEEDIEKYLKKIPELLDDEFLVSRILIRSREFDSTKRRAEELEILKQYHKSRADGVGFDELISLYSNDPNRFSGGDLGWLPARNLPSEYLDALLSMKDQEISEPLVLASGIHILKLGGVRRQDTEINEEVLVQRVLIEVQGDRLPEHSRIKAGFVYEQLQQGQPFDQMAQQYSDDVISSPSGGDMGWLQENDVSPEVWQVISSLRPGEFSAPVLSPFGWEIVRVKQRRHSDQTESLRRERARNNIIQSRMEGELIAWLREVRGGAYIEVVDQSFSPLDAGEDGEEGAAFRLPVTEDGEPISDFSTPDQGGTVSEIPLD